MHIGPIPIQVWGSFVALGMLISLVIVQKMAKDYEIQKNQAVDLFFYMILFGLIGGRLVHVFFYEPIYFLQNPVDTIKIWQGGMSSFGGIIGALSAFLYFAKKNKIGKNKLLRYADLYSFSALFGWIVGRIGCLMIHDHLGVLTDSFIAIQTPYGARLEMTVLEILLLIPLAIFFYYFKNKNNSPGFFTFILFLYYSVLRFVLDFFRFTDLPGADARYLGLTPAQYFGIISSVIVLAIWMKTRKKHGRIA